MRQRFLLAIAVLCALAGLFFLLRKPRPPEPGPVPPASNARPASPGPDGKPLPRAASAIEPGRRRPLPDDAPEILVRLVEDPEGAPAAEVKVVAFPRGAGDAAEARSGADGVALLKIAAPDVLLVAMPEERLPAHAEVRGLARGERREVALSLSRGALVEGRVMGPQGPVAGAGVRAEADLLLGEKETTTDAAGRFRLAGLPAGSVKLAARAPGLLPVVLETAIDLAPGQARRGLDLVFREGGAIAGVVRGPGGAGVARAKIQVLVKDLFKPLEAEADGAGAFRVAGLAAGEVTVRVEAAGFARGEARATLAEGEERRDFDLLLEPAAAIAGEVRGPTGELVGRVLLLVQADGRAPVAGESGPDGRFRVDGLGSGAAVLLARHPSYPEGRLALAAIAPGERREGVIVRLDAGAALEGRALSRDGRGIPGARIDAYRRDGDLHRRGVAREDGAFRVDGLAPGDWEIALRLRAGTPQVGAASARVGAADSIVRMDLVEGTAPAPAAAASPARPAEPGPATATIAGRAPPGATITASRMGEGPDAAPETYVAEADQAGRFRLAGLPPGRYVVAAMLTEPGQSPAEPRLVSIAAGGEASVELYTAPPPR